MENQGSPNTQPQSEDIDLGHLLQMIGRGFKKLFKVVLQLFVYFKRNAVKLGILGILGIAIGFGLNRISPDELKTEVIVKPNLESKNYLYDVVGEIHSNIRAQDTAFFQSLGIETEQLKGLRVNIEPVGEDKSEGNMEDDIKYLELLGKFENDEIVTDVVRSEILNKNSLNHRITFFYKNAQNGMDAARKLMDYINSNDYFTELVKINRENAQERIQQNSILVAQVDDLIVSYTNKIEQSNPLMEGKIVLDNEERVDITGLFNLKNMLIRDSERKKLEIQGQKEPIRIINFGRTQEVREPFFGKKVVLIPLLLFALFFLVEFIKFLNSKAKEMQMQ